MAFRPTILFAVANQGSTPRILAVQSAQAIDANVAGVTGFTLTGTTSLADGAGTPLAGLYESAFVITHTTGQHGTIAFDRAGFEVLDPILQGRLIQAFATGGLLVLTVDVAGPGLSLNLPIRLAALLTSDFLVDVSVTPPRAEPAHYPGVTATSNLVAPSSGTYDFSCAMLGMGTLTVSSAGAITITAGAPPVPTPFTAGTPPISASSGLSSTLTISTSLTENDGLGAPFAFTATSVLPIELHLPTEVIVATDRSGSMGAVTSTGASKWDEAIQAGNLFSTLFGDAVPDRTSPTTSVVDSASLKFSRWRQLVSFDVEYDPAAGFAAASSEQQQSTAESPDGGTPIGQALVDAVAKFTPGAWRRRHLLLLTDGMSNAGSPSLLDVHDHPGMHLPTLTGATIDSSMPDPAHGVVVHTLSYALPTDVPVITLEDLAMTHQGEFLVTGTDIDALDPSKLREMFLNVLGASLPIELSAYNAGDTDVLIEDGVERAIFISYKTSGGLTALGPNGETQDDANHVGNLVWALVNQPAPGHWTIGGATATEPIYAVFDVSLRTAAEVEPHGLGRPIRVRASLRYAGAPVTGADVRVALRRPGESVGEVITAFVRAQGLVRAVQRAGNRQLLHPELGPMLATRTPEVAGQKLVSAATVAAGVTIPGGDTRSLQSLLLAAAEDARNLPFQYVGHSLTLVEVAPGLYEGEVPAKWTQEEGVYDFRFKATGFTPGGYAFKRNLRRAVNLAPVPSAETSEVSIVQAPFGKGVLWTATVLPRTATGRALGPGLGYALAFQYQNAADAKRLPAPVTLDNLDGTYSARLELAKGQTPPPLVLGFGPSGTPAFGGITVVDKKRVKRVKVTLNRVQVRDDKDGLFGGRGELAFSALVAPNGNPHRAVKTRIPDRGIVKVGSGETLELNTVIFEGLVEGDATLAVTLGATEFDYFIFFTHEDKLSRYHRVLPLRTAKLAPDDEPNDPERLRDWRVWYTVDVVDAP